MARLQLALGRTGLRLQISNGQGCRRQGRSKHFSMGRKVVASYCTTFLKPEMLHIYRQVTALRRFKTFVITKAVENAQCFPFQDIEVLPRPHSNPLRHGWLKIVKRQPPVVYRGEYQMLASPLQRRRSDLMHIYFGHTAVHLLPFISQWDKPCVVSFHGADVARNEEIPDYEAKLRRLFEAVPLVFTRSQSLAERLIRSGCPPEQLRINRTGIPLHEFSFFRREAPSHGRWRVLQVCRLIAKTGIATSLRAFAIFQREYPSAEFLIAGKGSSQPQLETLAAELGITEKIRFCGFLSQPKLMALYASAHLFLHPSETPADANQEGIPNSILEAMATGLPVAATNHGGIPEAVEHRRTGLLVREADHVSLAAAMKEIVRKPDLSRAMGLRASEAVAANFAQEEQIRQLESYYEEAIGLATAEKTAPAKTRDTAISTFAKHVVAN